MAMSTEEAKLEGFLQWLKVNGVQLRGCKIKYCDTNKGFGIFSSNDVPSANPEILLVVPLDLAITPMRVLQDPLLGPECRAMFEEGEVDDRFLIMLFLVVERLRECSSWKPYLDLLPSTFGNPLWFSVDELQELRGTTLYHATQLQRKKLQSLFDEKFKNLAEKLSSLDGNPVSEVKFEDLLWANSVFWSRALNIPFPRSYVFPKIPKEQDTPGNGKSGTSLDHSYCENLVNGENGKNEVNELEPQVSGVASTTEHGETVWVEGLVPGIDFCNHDLRAAATWEVDGSGAATGTPFSMYLLSAGEDTFESEKEISISYGNKGNEELLYLYGFVMKDNPDDYLMVHYPVEALQDIPFSESKAQLLEAQKAELRCLLPRNLLNNGLFSPRNTRARNSNNCTDNSCSNYSWSGQRKTPSYINKLVFPEEFLAGLRTTAMKENEVFEVSSLLEELVGSGGDREPSDTEVRTAIWEVCGDSGAMQLLVDLLNTKIVELEEGTGTEENDTELLYNAQQSKISEGCQRTETNGTPQSDLMSSNKWSSIVYRRGQKRLTRLFLKEAEHALHLALSEGN